MPSSPALVYVVVGANRGIGFEYIKQLSTRNPTPIIFATSRTPTSSTELQEYTKTHNNVHIVQADLASTNSLNAAAKSVGEIVDGVDVLIVNGAQWEAGKVLDVENADRFDNLVLSQIDVNALGPIRALRAFLPLLRKKNTKKVIFISSTAGSIGINSGEGFSALFSSQVPYDTSKSTLNALTRQAAADLKSEGFTVIPLCPGMVATDMSTKATSNYPPEVVASIGVVPSATESVQKQLLVIDSVTAEQTGTFFSHENKVVPW